MGRRLGMTWFDLMQLHVTGSLNVSDGGNGSEKLFSKIMIAEMKGGSPFVLVLLEFGNSASEEHFEYNFECKSTMRVCTVKCMSKSVSDVFGVYGVIYRI